MSLLTVVRVLPNHLRRLPSPTHFCRRSLGHVVLATLQVLLSRPTTGTAPLATSLLAYRLASRGATRGLRQFSWGHTLFFRTVPSANTLVRWVNENAFASIVQARPCPTFGRPVRHRGSPHRLRPGTSPHALRIPPHGGHPALRSTARCGLQVRALSVSGFRLRAQLDVSIPSHLSPASEELPPLSDMAPLIRAPEGLQPS